MSIFKGTFKDYVKKQINLRQDLLNSKGNRPLDVQKYTASLPWVKMTSFVDYADPKSKIDPNIELAKKYVLLGGTLYPDWEDKTNTMFKLRSGILKTDSAYGTDLGAKGIGKANLQYGIRPMPGITSVSIKSKSAYGSLREATIKFYAWDVKQLEDLLILYMRPGYPVLLEWGWATYLDNKDGKGRSFDSPTINCFQDGITQNGIYSALDKYREQFSGNYDGMLGLIRNYETSMLPNGGFECTTTLISIGDVIDSLRMNSESGDITYLSKVENQSVNTNTQTPQNQQIKDEFEKLLNAYQYPRSIPNPDMISQARIVQIDLEADDIPGIDKEIYFAQSYVKSADGKIMSDDGSSISRYYMQFAYFVHILNSQKNLYSKNEKLLDIEIPITTIGKNKGNGLCLASNNSMTIDNNTCIIKNTSATFISKDGFVPKVIFADRYAHPESDETNDIAITNLKDYLYPNTNLGIIGNIYINIGKLIELYKIEHKRNNGFVYLGKYLKSILSEMEFSLGSINSFDIFVNENKTVIIDKHYVEDPANSSKASKFQINILGTDSIVRNQKIVSKIFPSQATIIAIAAQSRQNVASLQSSTYTYMNAGLKSRLIPNIETSPDQINSDIEKERNIFYRNLQSLSYYVANNIIPFSSEYNNAVNLSSINTFLNNFLVRIDKGTNYKAIIPVSLDISLDGISGVTIGEIFRINDDILPKEYENKNVGFIVTGISHEITRPDWSTTFTTQFCLLDQDKLQESVKEDMKELNLGFASYVTDRKSELRKSIRLYNILAAYFADLVKGNFQITYKGKGSRFNGTDLKVSYKDYTDAISGKQLKAKIEQNSIGIDGKILTLESFLEEIALQTTIITRNLSNNDYKAAIENINDKLDTYSGTGDFSFTKYDSDILTSTRFFKAMVPEVQTAFNNMLQIVIGQRRKKIPVLVVFELLDEREKIGSISEQGTFLPNKTFKEDIKMYDLRLIIAGENPSYYK